MKGDFSRHTFDPRKHYTDVLMQQGRVQLDADWNEQQAIHRYRAETAAQDVIGFSGAPAHDPGFDIVLTQDRLSFVIDSGNYYVAGILCENDAPVPYEGQPDLYDVPAVRDLLQQAGTNVGIVYLDVWRRHVTALDDRAIRESALGGPDTTTRIKTIWQVKVLAVKEPQAGFMACSTFFEEWEKLLVAGTGALNARSRPAVGVQSPCIFPASAGYRGLENQLYRLEIHKAGVLGDPNNVPTFKWSRDNGTVVTAIEKMSGQEVTVRDLGRDDVLGFASGQWVEILDDAVELSGKPGQLVQIDQINLATRVIKLATAPTPLASGAVGVEPKRHPKLRRWDSLKDLPVQVPATNEGFLALENGVEVKFEAGAYSTGDYWLIPARTAITGETGSIEWPFTTLQRPLGIQHHYCRVALVRRNPTDNTLTVQDCRKVYRPLTGVEALHVVGTNWLNDDVMPSARLEQDGMQITLDGVPSQPTQEVPAAPPSVNPGSFIVTIEAPVSPSTDPNAILPRVTMITNGTITVEKNSIQWKPDLAELRKLLQGPPSLRLVRITLKGHAIWTIQAGQVLYLDGQAFGRPGLRPGGEARTDLVFPSGMGVRASDFESWMFVPAVITPPLPDLVSLTVTPAVVRAGQPVTVVLTLNRLSLSGGTVIALAKTLLSGFGDPVPALPQTATVPEGQTTLALSVQTRADATGSVSIKAGLRGVEKTASLTTRIVSVTIAPATASLFTRGDVQFSAKVEGETENNAVTFSIQEGATGGSIAPTGPTRATYTAPAAPGVFHVVATSVEDLRKSASATVTVTQKGKDSKETKDIKDKDVEKPPREKIEEKPPREKILLIEKTRDQPNLADARVQGEVGPRRGTPERPADAREEDRTRSEMEATAGEGSEGKRQAFIRPDERPPVGEPKGAAKKPSRKRAARRKSE